MHCGQVGGGETHAMESEADRGALSILQSTEKDGAELRLATRLFTGLRLIQAVQGGGGHVDPADVSGLHKLQDKLTAVYEANPHIEDNLYSIDDDKKILIAADYHATQALIKSGTLDKETQKTARDYVSAIEDVNAIAGGRVISAFRPVEKIQVPSPVAAAAKPAAPAI
jgi:hypothetical protein